MRLSGLRDKKVKTLDGQTVGRIHDVHCDQGRIVALMCGAPSFIERLTARTHGRRVPWEEVLRIENNAVIIGPRAAQDGPSASRSRRGTRRASAPRPKR